MKLKTLDLLEILPLPSIYYDARKDFYIPNDHDGWTVVSPAALSKELVLRGYDDDSDPDEDLMSEVAEVVNKIQRSHSVDFVGKLAGWKKGFYETDNGRILITESTKLIQPVEGDWTVLESVLGHMLGDRQLPYLYGWLKMALEALEARQPRLGQALVLCGPANSGKNLLRKLITEICGGKVAKPYQYMTGKTAFNYDLFEAATLAVEDESGSREIRVRQNFGDAIKNITANEEQRCHRKYGDPVTLRPCWRLIISLNDEPVKMLVLPPMESDIADKMILFKVFKHPMPMPTATTAERTAFWAKLTGELPAFLHFLKQWQIPADMRGERFGIKHYHHHDLLTGLQQFSQEEKLRDLIDETIFAPGNPKEPWIGRAEDLRRELRTSSAHQREVDEILPHANSCGTLLGRLANLDPVRFSSVLVQGRTRWTIDVPSEYESRGRSYGDVKPMRQELIDILTGNKWTERQNRVPGDTDGPVDIKQSGGPTGAE